MSPGQHQKLLRAALSLTKFTAQDLSRQTELPPEGIALWLALRSFSTQPLFKLVRCERTNGEFTFLYEKRNDARERIQARIDNTRLLEKEFQGF